MLTRPRTVEARLAGEAARKALGPLIKIDMPRRNDGSPCPCPVRWGCGLGHFHPSRRHADKCRARYVQRVEALTDKGRR